MQKTQSNLNGKIWYWRQGIKQMPLHSDLSIKTSELCLVVSDFIEANRILRTLKSNGILADMKNTHSDSNYIPADSLIVYAYTEQDKKDKEKENNIEKLKNYILSNGGKIGNKQPENTYQNFSFKELFSGLFSKGK